VLLVAPSNIAVDVATLQFLRLLANAPGGGELISQRKILRYGYPRDEQILRRPELLGSEELEELSGLIESGYRKVRRLTEDHAPEGEVAACRAEMKQLAERRKARMATHVAASRFVATTLAALAAQTCPLLQAGPWQSVILDEASMVGGAAVMFVSSLATRRFLVAGDPRQLGPVFEWNYGDPPPAIQTWLARDPYEIAGLSSGGGVNKCVNTHDSRVARIMAQRRCHPDLWKMISGLYPDIQSEIDAERLQELAGLSPGVGQSFVFLDWVQQCGYQKQAQLQKRLLAKSVWNTTVLAVE
jgi:hypothetical protein